MFEVILKHTVLFLGSVTWVRGWAKRGWAKKVLGLQKGGPKKFYSFKGGGQKSFKLTALDWIFADKKQNFRALRAHTDKSI